MVDFPYQASTGIPYLAVIVEALRWVAWPVAAIFVARAFREPISNAVNKLTGLSYGSVKAEFTTQTSQAENLDKPLGPLLTPGISKLNVNIDANLTLAQKEVRDFVKHELTAFEASQHLDVLLASVAIERLQKHFALAYINIFGSQIRALELLNQRNQVISRDEALALFSGLQAEHRELKDWTLDRYLTYLRDFKLVEMDETEIRLTPIGRDFVVWLTGMGMFKGKPL